MDMSKGSCAVSIIHVILLCNNHATYNFFTAQEITVHSTGAKKVTRKKSPKHFYYPDCKMRYSPQGPLYQHHPLPLSLAMGSQQMFYPLYS